MFWAGSFYNRDSLKNLLFATLPELSVTEVSSYTLDLIVTGYISRTWSRKRREGKYGPGGRPCELNREFLKAVPVAQYFSYLNE